MRKRLCKEVCPFCHRSENTVYKNRHQCYCKTCDKFFKIGGTTRNEHSKDTSIILKTINNLLFQGGYKSELTIKSYTKEISKAITPIKHNPKIKYRIMPIMEDPTEESVLYISENFANNSIILINTNNGYQIIRGLNSRQKIQFKDCTIRISANGKMKRISKTNEHIYEEFSEE